MARISGPVVRTIRQAHVQPVTRPDGKIYGGLVLGDDPESLLLRQHRRNEAVDHFAPVLRDPVKLPGSYAYLGLTFGHFGHAMAEMIHRIVPTRQIVSDPRWLIVAEQGSEPRFDALPALIRSILAVFGVDEANCTVISSDAIVEELLVVEAGSNLGGGPKDWYLDLLSTYGPGVIARREGYPQKVYVARSGLDHGSGLLGEHVLETILADAGFHIMRSERLPLPEQFALYANAEVLLFAEGSACHGVEVFGREALAHTILMNRRHTVRSQFEPVLAPRSKRFDSYTGNPYLGSLFCNKEGAALRHRGIAAIAMHDLARFLSEIGAADLGQIPTMAYLAAAHADLERYVARAKADPAFVGPEQINALDVSLAAAVQAGGSIAPARRSARRSQERPISPRKAEPRDSAAKPVISRGTALPKPARAEPSKGNNAVTREERRVQRARRAKRLAAQRGVR